MTRLPATMDLTSRRELRHVALGLQCFETRGFNHLSVCISSEGHFRRRRSMSIGFIEGLESRTLFSAGPALFNATIKLDRAIIRADLLRFKADLVVKSAR